MYAVNKILSTVLLVLLLLSSLAFGFETDGFATRMSRAEAVSQIERLGLTVHKESGSSSILATGKNRLYSLSFCGEI